MKHEWIPTETGWSVPCLHRIGGGEALVCVSAHGFGSSKSSPTNQLLLQGLPARGVGVLAFDFPLHGESPDGAPPLRLETCFDALAAAEARARSLAPRAQVVYFGSSFGAYVTLLYLTQRPQAGRRAFLRSAAVCMPELFHHKTPEEEARRFAVRFQIPLTVIPGEDHRLSIPGAPELVLERAAAFFLGRS